MIRRFPAVSRSRAFDARYLEIEIREFTNPTNELVGLQSRSFEIGAPPQNIDVDGVRVSFKRIILDTVERVPRRLDFGCVRVNSDSNRAQVVSTGNLLRLTEAEQHLVDIHQRVSNLSLDLSVPTEGILGRVIRQPTAYRVEVDVENQAIKIALVFNIFRLVSPLPETARSAEPPVEPAAESFGAGYGGSQLHLTPTVPPDLAPSRNSGPRPIRTGLLETRLGHATSHDPMGTLTHADRAGQLMRFSGATVWVYRDIARTTLPIDGVVRNAMTAHAISGRSSRGPSSLTTSKPVTPDVVTVGSLRSSQLRNSKAEKPGQSPTRAFRHVAIVSYCVALHAPVSPDSIGARL